VKYLGYLEIDDRVIVRSNPVLWSQVNSGSCIEERVEKAQLAFLSNRTH
jgi:hypothetical protein